MRPQIMENEEVQQKSTYDKYKESFGCQVSIRRNERKLTTQDLAKSVSELANGRPQIDKQTIIEWEVGEAIPDQHQFDALVSILVEQNAGIPEEQKEEEKEAFKLAYTRSKKLMETHASVNDPATRRLKSSFARILLEYRDAGNISLQQLADGVAENTKIEFSEEESRLLRKEPDYFMAAIEAGAVHPSKGLAVALVSALSQVKELDEEGKKSLYDAYEAISSSQTSHAERVRTGNGADRPRRQRETNPAKASEEAQLLKLELIEQFKRDESDVVDKTKIIRRIQDKLEEEGIDRKTAHGRVSVLYAILNEDIASAEKIYKSLNRGAKEMLSGYLAEIGKDEAQIQAFQAKFDSLRDIVSKELAKDGPAR